VSQETQDFITRPDQKLQCEWVPHDAIEPNEWNPNEMEDDERDLLRRSILNQGWTNPIVVHADELYIIDGEQRWTVAGSDETIATDEDLTPDGVPAGYVPVFGITLSEDRARISTVQHNRARGFVEYESLYDYFQEFQADDQLSELLDELQFDEESALRIVDDESVADRVRRETAGELSPPWEPVDMRDADQGADADEYATASASLAKRSSEPDTDGPTEGVDRIDYVLSEDERDFVHAVLSDDNTTEVLLAYANYMDDTGLIDDFRTVTGIEESEEHPHPDNIEWDWQEE